MIFSTRKQILFLAVLSIAVSALVQREKIELGSPHHGPIVGNVDKFCPRSSIVNNTCTIENKDIRLTYDFIYETSLNLIF